MCPRSGFCTVVPFYVPSFWFLVPSFRFCTLAPVLGVQGNPAKTTDWKPPFCEPPIVGHSGQKCEHRVWPFSSGFLVKGFMFIDLALLVTANITDRHGVPEKVERTSRDTDSLG